ncbi:MAG TPA: cytochrome c-type biogenesis protein CcmH [Candidatus Binataceae bacterium]|jgi:cytochrome c-type biogenesis protein CcmH|nr:cytochrome c-type biogenesis protein CcmH [Candidatus Binataceae bacterium]
MNARGREFSAPAMAAVLAAILIASLMAPIRPAHAAAATRQEIAEGLTCQCGCGLTVANCNHPNCSFSVPMRERIDTMLAHGMGRAEIIGYFRKQYGEKILSAPTTQGFNLLAWTMPFVALMMGGGLVVLMMGRWRGRASAAPESQQSGSRQSSGGSGAGDSEPSSKAASALRERLERELRERL